jgi:hypothetical protein
MAGLVELRSGFQKVLNGLFDRTVPVAPVPKFEPAATKPAVIAVYTTEDDKVVAVAVCSLAAAAYLGASLSLVPKAVAEDNIKRNNLEEALLENFREVANILASLVTEHLGGRARLDRVIPKAVASPAELKAVMGSAHRIDVSFDLPNYGQGIVSMRLIAS